MHKVGEQTEAEERDGKAYDGEQRLELVALQVAEG